MAKNSIAIYEPNTFLCLVDSCLFVFSLIIICCLGTKSNLYLTAIFVSTYPWEEAFFQMETIKTKCQKRMTNEHLKFCLHSCLSNYKSSSSNDSWWMNNVMHKFFSIYLFLFITLYMFRAHRAHHQERQIVSIHPLVTLILWWWPRCVQVRRRLPFF